MTWTRWMVAAPVAALLVAGCTERENRTERAAERTEQAGERAAERTGQAGERAEGALERGGERVAEAGREAGQAIEEAGEEFVGSVKRVTNDVIEVGDRELRIGDDTEFFRDGERITREDIRPGDEVRATFDEMGDELRAKRVEVQGKKE